VASPGGGSGVVENAPASGGQEQPDRPGEATPADPPGEADSDPADPSDEAEGAAGDRARHKADASPAVATGEAVAHVEIERVVELWPAVVDHVRESGSEMLSSLFDAARPLGVDEERSLLRIGFPAAAKFNKRKAEAPPNVELIAESLQAIVGARLKPTYELIEGEPSGPRQGDGATAMPEEEIIELLKANFDASEVVADDSREETG
jgi:hypothetical protein